MTRVLNSGNFQSGSGHSLMSGAQLEVDALQASFSEQALNPVNLLAMTAGGLTARFARVAASPFLSVFPPLIRNPLISAFSLTAEVAAFRGVNHAFHSSQENYWNAQGFAREMINFGCLKGVGHLLQTANSITAHVIQNLGMMLGEELGARIHLTEQNERSFAERFVNASVTNLALGAGTAFSGMITGHRVSMLERNLEQRSFDISNTSMRTRYESGQEKISVMSAFNERDDSLPIRRRPYIKRNIVPVLSETMEKEVLEVRKKMMDLRKLLNSDDPAWRISFALYHNLWRDVPARKGWSSEIFWREVGIRESIALREQMEAYEARKVRPLHYDEIFARILNFLPDRDPETRRWWDLFTNSLGRGCAFQHYQVLIPKIAEVSEQAFLLAERIRYWIGKSERRDVPREEIYEPEPDTGILLNSTGSEHLERACLTYTILLGKIDPDHAEYDFALETFLELSQTRPEALIVLNFLLPRVKSPISARLAGMLENTLTSLRASRVWKRTKPEVDRQTRFVNILLDLKMDFAEELYPSVARNYLDAVSPVNSQWMSLDGAEMLAKICRRRGGVDLTRYVNRLKVRIKGESNVSNILALKVVTNDYSLPENPQAILIAREIIEKDPVEQEAKKNSPLQDRDQYERQYVRDICDWVHCLRLFCILRSALPEFKPAWPERALYAIESGDVSDVRMADEGEDTSLREILRVELAEQAQRLGVATVSLLRDIISDLGISRNLETDEEVRKVILHLKTKVAAMSDLEKPDSNQQSPQKVFEDDSLAQFLTGPRAIKAAEEVTTGGGLIPEAQQDIRESNRVTPEALAAAFLSGPMTRDQRAAYLLVRGRLIGRNQVVERRRDQVVLENREINRGEDIALLARVFGVDQVIAERMLEEIQAQIEAGVVRREEAPLNPPTLETQAAINTLQLFNPNPDFVVPPSSTSTRRLQAARMIAEEARVVEIASSPRELARVVAAQALLRENASPEQVALLEEDAWGRRVLALLREETPAPAATPSRYQDEPMRRTGDYLPGEMTPEEMNGYARRGMLGLWQMPRPGSGADTDSGLQETERFDEILEAINEYVERGPANPLPPGWVDVFSEGDDPPEENPPYVGVRPDLNPRFQEVDASLDINQLSLRDIPMDIAIEVVFAAYANENVNDLPRNAEERLRVLEERCRSRMNEPVLTPEENEIRNEISQLRSILMAAIQSSFEEGSERDWEVNQVERLYQRAMDRINRAELRGRRVNPPPEAFQGENVELDSEVVLARLRYLAEGSF